MAPTSDERRDVAAALRVITTARAVENLTLGEILNSALTGGAPRPTTETAILARLADLIDPTCHPVPSDGGFFTCSECGERIGAVLPALGTVLPHHCSHCGARVVEEGER